MWKKFKLFVIALGSLFLLLTCLCSGIILNGGGRIDLCGGYVADFTCVGHASDTPRNYIGPMQIQNLDGRISTGFSVETECGSVLLFKPSTNE